MMHFITFGLLVVGGLNWLLYGAFQWEIGMLFGGMSMTISRVIYVLVGLSAVYELVMHKKNCKACDAKGGSMSSGMPQRPSSAM